MQSFVRWQNHAESDRMLNTSSKAGVGAIAAKVHLVPTPTKVCKELEMPALCVVVNVSFCELDLP